MRMKALKTFRVGDTGVTVRPGSEFESSAAKARHYEANGMAVPIHAVAKTANPVTEMVKDHFQKESDKLLAGAAARPTSPPGGPTGEAKPSSSSAPAPAPRTRRSSKRAAKQDS